MGSGSEVKVLGNWPSPFTLRTQIALNIKSVEYEYQSENVLVSKSDLLLQSNPVYKKIPVLIHGGRPICESLIIVQYIDEVWASGPAILPSDPYDRALARFWSTYIDDKWAASLTTILQSDEEETKNTAKEAATQGLALLEDTFTNYSKGQKFFGGERIGYLDISLGSYLAWIGVIKKVCNICLIDESNTPNLFKWAQDFSTDDAVKDVLPDTDKVVEFSKHYISVLKGSRSTN